MTYHDQWKALSSRIRGLMQAGELHSHFLRVRSSDSHGVAKRLREQCEGVLTLLRTFRSDFEHSLPPTALVQTDEFLTRTGPLIVDTSGTAESLRERVWAALVLLGAFETELSFLLSDTQETIRTRSERAFSHLQRSIVADPEFREKWKTAFEDGEVACEKLGAVHLLLHGIWAFKVDAAGARTDLVYQEPVDDLTDEAHGLQHSRSPREARPRSIVMDSESERVPVARCPRARVLPAYSSSALTSMVSPTGHNSVARPVSSL